MIPTRTHLKTRVALDGSTVTVSTVELPNGRYETCLFWGGNSEVVDTYAHRATAIDGHQSWCEPATLAVTLHRIQMRNRD